MKSARKAPGTKRVTPSLRTLARRALEGEASVAPRRAILVAVSGGPDSMALLDVLGRLGRTLELDVLAHGVDHGLRAAARGELDLAEAHAARLGVPFARTTLAVARGGNLQERARLARWAVLTAAARDAGAAIATGHHEADRAETFLLRLLRGSGLRGLGVMPPRSPAVDAPDVLVVRPLLRASRADILTHLARHGVRFAEDPSNVDPRYLRARVRRELVPLLESLDPAIVRHLAQLADEACALEREGPERATAGRHWTAGLPRATQDALRHLAETRSPSARVWLPGGLVASAAARRPDEKPARRGAPASRPRRG